MPGRADQASHLAAIARVTELASAAPSIRKELERVVESPAFRGSRRSQRFLTYIVQNALEGKFDQLKERTIGIELFGRDPSYDTGEDSIVRVTATDVRKRLFNYYAGGETGCEIRIELPAGSYIPEIHRVAAESPVPAAPAAAAPESVPPEPAQAVPEPVPQQRRWLLWSGAGAAIVIAAWLVIDMGGVRARISGAGGSPALYLPWSAVLDREHRTFVVLSDTNFAAIQDLTGQRVRLPEYANRKFLEKATGLSPGAAQAIELLTRNQFTSFADAGIAVRIAELAHASRHKVTVRPARNMQVRDFHTDDSFILIGSARANPWSELIEDRLDFVIEYDSSIGRQVCRNRRPLAGELPSYVPTAVTGQTGEAYAVIAFVPNPAASGHFLLIAGTNMEGTEAASEFAMSPGRMPATLAKHGIDANGRPSPFQILLKLRSLAGAAAAPEVIAVHKLTR